jgi:hypothetical protein
MSAQTTLDLSVFNKIGEAPTFRPPEFRGASIKQVNIVRKGTVEGKATVDIVFEDDETGQKSVVLITGALITMVASAIAGAEARPD